MKRLFELCDAGKLRTVVLPYLGQDDSRLKHRPDDLVTREEAYAYPTDFVAMSEEWIERLSRRGEQLTKALVAEHAQELAAKPAPWDPPTQASTTKNAATPFDGPVPKQNAP